MAKKNEKNSKDKTSFTKKFKAELKKVIWDCKEANSALIDYEGVF